jgi:hypothetical protein
MYTKYLPIGSIRYCTKKGWKNIFESKSQTDFGHQVKLGVLLRLSLVRETQN